MNAKIRRRLEMGARALGYSRSHPDASRGYAVAVARLEELMTRAARLEVQQHNGLVQVHAAAVRKRELRRTIKLIHLAHLARVAESAVRTVPELAGKFVLDRMARPYLVFRSAARQLEGHARAYQEILEQYGLAEPVLEGLSQALDRFDEASRQVVDGIRAHVGATAELKEIAAEVVRIVEVMDGFNRLRFAAEPQFIAEWESSSRVLRVGERKETPERPETT